MDIFGVKIDIDIDEIRKETLSDKSIERIIWHRIKMSEEEYRQRLKYIAAAVAVATALAIGAANALVSDLQERFYIDTIGHNFHTNVISTNTYRTDDGQHYFYATKDIADAIENSNNTDEDIYLLVLEIGEYQTDLVLQNTEFKSLENYLRMRGFNSLDDFSNDARKRIILESDIKNHQDELQRMNQEHPKTVTINVGGVGGKI